MAGQHRGRPYKTVRRVVAPFDTGFSPLWAAGVSPGPMCNAYFVGADVLIGPFPPRRDVWVFGKKKIIAAHLPLHGAAHLFFLSATRTILFFRSFLWLGRYRTNFVPMTCTTSLRVALASSSAAVLAL